MTALQCLRGDLRHGIREDELSHGGGAEEELGHGLVIEHAADRGETGVRGVDGDRPDGAVLAKDLGIERGQGRREMQRPQRTPLERVSPDALQTVREDDRL